MRVLAGDRSVAPGYVGLTLGAADAPDLPRIVRDAIEQAWRRASVNAEMKADARAKVNYGGSDPRKDGAAIPEPSAWTLMLAGFGLTGLLIRRRRADPTFRTS